jgi:AraC family transcriptional regulator, regulatory protein of adaptative response / methylated-DNA-[protein]-cysteine methyltransferase
MLLAASTRQALSPAPLITRGIETPLGAMHAVAGDQGLCLLEFVDRRALATQIAVLRRRFGRVVVPERADEPHPLLTLTAREIGEYFAGERTTFTIPLLAPGTPFQEQVWAELQNIPAGQTRSYLQLARAIGRPTATRAVARANGDNRLAILIPCHRVIGADGSPTGYGGGIWRKQRLLELERADAGLFASGHAAAATA